MKDSMLSHAEVHQLHIANGGADPNLLFLSCHELQAGALERMP